MIIMVIKQLVKILAMFLLNNFSISGTVILYSVFYVYSLM